MSKLILCAFCQKNFFFAIKLHKKKIIVVGEYQIAVTTATSLLNKNLSQLILKNL